MRNDKRPAFKKGDRVLYYRQDQYGIHLTEATVTAVRQVGEHWIVHTLFSAARGSTWKQRFTTAKNGHRPYPRGDDYRIDALRLLSDKDNMKKLVKRALDATERYRKHRETADEIRRQVRFEAQDWERHESERRVGDLPDGLDFMYRVLSRMGFRRPRLT